jgi:hypothetical protein
MDNLARKLALRVFGVLPFRRKRFGHNALGLGGFLLQQFPTRLAVYL